MEFKDFEKAFKLMKCLENSKEKDESESVRNYQTEDHPFIGSDVIVRTYSAGCWFGRLKIKCKDEVILEDARRLWYWKADKSISLSAVAVYGLKTDSKVCAPVREVWVQAIEIIPTTIVAAANIKSQKEAEAR